MICVKTHKYKLCENCPECNAGFEEVEIFEKEEMFQDEEMFQEFLGKKGAVFVI